MSKLTKVKIRIGNTVIEQFSDIVITQKMASHHSFKLVCPAEVFDKANSGGLESGKSLIGQAFNIGIEGFENKGGIFEFLGLVTHVQAVKFSGHVGDIVISGASPTVLLDHGLHCKSWENKTVKEIADDVAKVFASNLLRFKLKPEFTEAALYTVQYKETAWQFLNRIAATYGEWLYYNGKELVMGKTKQKEGDLQYGANLTEFGLGMQIGPMDFSSVAYNYERAQSQRIYPEAVAKQAGLNTIGNFAYEKSQQVFNTEPKSYEHAYAANLGLLEHMVNSSAAATAASLVQFNGSALSFDVQLGHIVNISNNYGKYAVIEVTHRCDGQGNYYNEFIAIPSSILVPPITGYSLPAAEAQPAKVTANYDTSGLGRVRVRMKWMNENEMSPWIRIVGPHAGGGKGMFFMPELDEEVMVAFENGDPTKPYIMGAMYNGSQSNSYSNAGNDVKAIQTRSGIKIIYNDAEGSLLIKDPSGNSWLMDGKGNMKVDVPQNLTMNVGKNFELNVGENMNTVVGSNETVSVGRNKTETVSKDYTHYANNASLTVQNNKTDYVTNSFKHVAGDSDMQTSKGDMKIRGTSLTVIQGGKDVKVSKG